jgi:hypothetical protein
MGYTNFKMSRTAANIFIILVTVVALALLAGLIWANTSYVRSRPVDKTFLIPWLGARTFLQYGENPYGTEATQRAQIVYYGRAAEKGEDPLALWLPFPVELFYLPFGLVTDYALARGIWMTLMEIALGALAFISLRLIDWKPPRLLLALVLLVSIFWVYGAISILSGSGAGFVALALAGFLLAMKEGHDEVAGALFLLTGTMPSLTGLLLFFFLWWVFYRRRWRVLWGVLMALALLLAVAFLLLPNWILPFIRGWFSHLPYTETLSSVKLFASWSPAAGLRVGWALAALFLLLLCVEWGAAMRDEYRQVAWTVCLTITVMPLMGASTSIGSYVLLFVPLMILVGVLAGRRGNSRRWGAASAFLIGVFLASWALTAILTFAGRPVALTQSLFLLLPLLLLPGLYWVRWRFTRRSEPELSASI